MVDKKTWEEFRDTGLFWWINNILHTFGWSLVVELGDKNEILSVYPARVKYRGFSEKSTSEGHIKVASYLKENIDDILSEAKS